MNIKLQHTHPWTVSIAEARAIQERLAGQVIRENRLGEIVHVAGVDVGFEQRNTITRAAVVVLRLADLEPVDQAIARCKTVFPYVPGYLSFREIPAVIEALQQLTQLPDLLLCDGQGIAHPRRIGIASHLGVLTGLPSIGVAKSRLIGRHGRVPATRGRWCPLLDGDECIGAVLRTRVQVKPLFISIGHKIDLDTAIGYVMRCTTRYRLPETTRHAHRLASGPL